MKKIKLPLFIIFCLLSQFTFAAQVKGSVYDKYNDPLSFASVYVKNSTLGVATNLKGRYIFELGVGHYVLVFSYLGYQTVEKEIDIIDNNSILTLDVEMQENATELGVVEVVGNTKGLAKEIMSKVRQKRKFYLNQVQAYQCETYIKTSLDRKIYDPSKKDTTLIVEEKHKFVSKRKKRKNVEKNKKIKENREAFFNKDNLELVETVSELYFKAPNTFKEKIIANHDYSKKYQPNASISIYSDYGEIAPVQWKTTNPHLFYAVTDPDFNFYKNTIYFPSVCSRPILSPLAFNAPLNYTYNFEGSFMEDGHKIYKIKVKPIFKGDALFSGLLFIQDSTFSIKSVDLEINRAAMMNVKDFKILQNYELIDGKYSMPVRREILYTVKERKDNFLGNVSVRHSKYKINPKFKKRFFNAEEKIYLEDAFEKDSLFWVETRPITFKKEELDFMIKSDSIQHHFESPAYKQELDSIYNDIGIWDVLLNGFGHSDYKKRYVYFIFPVIEQLNFLGIGGYRHKLGGDIRYEFLNNDAIELDGFIDYGFRNQDVKGKIGIGYNYLPKKFMRTFVRFGDYYGQINNYESVEAIFSRANYIREKSFSIEQKMEIVNGLYGELTYTFSDQIPISGLQLSDWSKEVFGEQNTPTEFTEYNKSEIKLRLQYRPYQKYYYVHNKKVILGTDWPEFFLEYRKGIKGLFASEVDFDYLEFGVKDYRRLGRWGYSNWAAKLGSFVNHKDLRFLEHKFFRGSDYFFFSNPVNSFQLLGPTLNTRNEFFHANFIHHFEGAILGKVPLIRFFKLELAGGLGTLAIRDINFAHFEMYAGLERKFSLWRQQFRFSIYGVTADNSLSKADIRFKIGMSYYNDYSKRWDY